MRATAMLSRFCATRRVRRVSQVREGKEKVSQIKVSGVWEGREIWEGNEKVLHVMVSRLWEGREKVSHAIVSEVCEGMKKCHM